jgi:hypothetical protein
LKASCVRDRVRDFTCCALPLVGQGGNQPDRRCGSPGWNGAVIDDVLTVAEQVGSCELGCASMKAAAAVPSPSGSGASVMAPEKRRVNASSNVPRLAATIYPHAAAGKPSGQALAIRLPARPRADGLTAPCHAVDEGRGTVVLRLRHPGRAEEVWAELTAALEVHRAVLFSSPTGPTVNSRAC